MLTSVSKKLFDFVITKLNTNPQKVVFSGNYIFRFWQQGQGVHNFEILKKSIDGTNIEAEQVVPVVDVQTIQIPFVEENGRSDWERQFYIAVEIEETINEFNQRVIEFDESNTQYQAILHTLQEMESELTYVDGEYTYTFKVKEPIKVNIFKYNGKYYQIFSLTFNMTTVKKGFFGNDLKVYFGRVDDSNFGATEDYKLDTIAAKVIMSKTMKEGSTLQNQDQVMRPIKRVWMMEITTNLIGSKADIELVKEHHGLVEDTKIQYQIRVINSAYESFLGETLDYTRNVIVSSVAGAYVNNVLDQLTFKIERG